MTIFLAVSFIANYAFNQKVEKEIEELFSKVKNKGEIVTREDISDLPKNVKKWLEYSGIIGKEGIQHSKIYSELPTLNDVFLELTGKELRD
jgi:hypothetical protein